MIRRACALHGLVVSAVLAITPAGAAAGPSIPELVEVADITSLSAAPSGTKIAFRVERASIEGNDYTLEWYLADLAIGLARRIGSGGSAIEGRLEPLAVERVAWSGDEAFVFHRARIDGAIGIWRTATDGSGSWPVVVGDADVEDFFPNAGGAELTYTLGPSRDEIARAEQREYDDGILVDGSIDLEQNLYRGGWVAGRLASQRLIGRWYSRAGLLWREPRTRFRLDLRTGRTIALSKVDSAQAEPFVPAAGVTLALEEDGRPVARAHRNGQASWLEVMQDGAEVRCTKGACRSPDVAWMAWRPGTEQLAFATQDRHFRQSLHLWDTRAGSLRTVVSGDGLLSGSRVETRPCAITHAAAVCVTAGAASAPRLEAIGLADGKRTVLFDPNPGLRRGQSPRPEHVSWTLADGRLAAGTLLVPRQLDGRAPLFITYYHCPGYLRGGLGDEFPLAPLADAGFVVGCLNIVPSAEADVVTDYRTAFASVEALVRLLDQRGLIDPALVGMGGFSAGSEATMWIAANSGLLAAAAIASPQGNPSSYWSHARPGRDYAGPLRAFFGLGAPEDTPDRWRAVSPAFSTERITLPLLMQLPENEARTQAEIFTRLKSAGRPVELLAFPDESHIKWQPRHRQAVYRRNLDWFRYWLQGYSDPDPAKADQYRRWDRLRMQSRPEPDIPLAGP